MSKFSPFTLSLAAKGAALSLFALAGATVHAEPSVALDRVSIAAGAFNAEPKISAGVQRDDGYLSTGEQDGSRVTLPRVKADVLIGDSQGISLDYYRFDKSYDTALSGSTTRNGQQLSGSGTANAKLQLDLAQLAYKFWLGSGNDVFGIGLGAGYYHARIDGNATGTVSTTTGPLTTTRTFSGNSGASESAFAPLLEVGYRHAFSPDLRFVADVSGVKKNGGRLNGHIYSGTAGIEWFFAKNVGLVADYGIQKIQLGRDGDRRADLNVKLTGPSAYIKVRF
ncbi:MAG: hypothetical protein M3Y65_13040 [Pseudomonadota bacterium]|nr:hypothetical protein [Pseudomonadota bacterium]